MKKSLFTFSFLLPVMFLLFGPTQVRAQSEEADLTTIDGTIIALYDVISGPAGMKRNWELFRYLFAPDAHLRTVQTAPGQAPSLVTMTPDEYIERVSDRFLERGFFEYEVSKKVDSFGHIVQVFSTYESRQEASGPVVQRGINSIQLAWYNKRYWIVSILWNGETEEHVIPGKYLGN